MLFLGWGAAGIIFWSGHIVKHTFAASAPRSSNMHVTCCKDPAGKSTSSAKLFPNLEESLVSTIDVSEAFDIKPILERISSVRSFEEGHVDLLRFHEQSP